MTQSITRTAPDRLLPSNLRTALVTGVAAAALFAAGIGAHAQDAASPTDPTPQAAATPAQPKQDITLSNQKPAKVRKQKEEKVVASKDTKKVEKQVKKDNQLEGVDVKLPDKALYDKAEDAVKHGRFDVARLLLQDLLNTYQDSQFQMRAKLAIADSWYKEGGTAALTQAEQEYKDFITFFPNAPEAAEAQMRVGDIYFRQMDKPDRDYTNTTHAEEEYRLMLQQFPDSPLVPQAQQRLREVQETLASREADIAAFYASHQNWSASIAREQTVVDTYPLYSHIDEVLINIGDAYEAMAHLVRSAPMPEAPKARLEKLYDSQAQAAYEKVVLEHSAAPHVEDAKDRLVGMNLPVPTPTPEQLAASAALENSRGQYTLSKRAMLLFLNQADTVPAATMGTPSLEDPKPTLAPTIARQAINDYYSSMNPGAVAQPAPAAPASADAAPAADATAPAAAPIAFQDVPAATSGSGGSSAIETSVPASSPAATGGTAVGGIEIVHSSDSQPTTAPASTAFPGTTQPAAAAPPSADANGGLKPLPPSTAAPLPPIEKAAAAPDTVNEATPGPVPPQATSANGKKPKAPALDKGEDSSSKKKKKKGIAKINPF